MNSGFRLIDNVAPYSVSWSHAVRNRCNTHLVLSIASRGGRNGKTLVVHNVYNRVHYLPSCCSDHYRNHAGLHDGWRGNMTPSLELDWQSESVRSMGGTTAS